MSLPFVCGPTQAAILLTRISPDGEASKENRGRAWWLALDFFTRLDFGERAEALALGGANFMRLAQEISPFVRFFDNLT